jgi:micrococcal nuclease
MNIVVALATLLTVPLLGAETIPSAQAKDHVGETGIVCGHVADARYQDTGSHVTFLNFDKAFPNHTFTAFIPADSRSKFDAPEKNLKDKNVCVSGKIEDYHGKPEIVVTAPEQLKLEEK